MEDLFVERQKDVVCNRCLDVPIFNVSLKNWVGGKYGVLMDLRRHSHVCHCGSFFCQIENHLEEEGRKGKTTKRMLSTCGPFGYCLVVCRLIVPHIINYFLVSFLRSISGKVCISSTTRAQCILWYEHVLET